MSTSVKSFPTLHKLLPTSSYVVVDLEGHGLECRTNPHLPVYFGSVCEVNSEGTPKPQRFNNVWSLVVYLNVKLDEGYSFVMHNAKFDWLALRVRGFAAPIERVYCTQVLAYLLDNQRDSYSLDSLTGEKEDLIANLVDEGFLDKKVSKSDFWNIDHSSNEPLLERLKDYCDSDVRATYHLYKKLCAVLNVEAKASVRSAYYCIDQPMMECLCDLEQSGIQIDEELLLDSICTFLVEKHKLVSVINERFSLMPKLVWDAKADEFVPDIKAFAGGAYKNSLHVPPYYTDNHGIYMRSWQGHQLDILPLVVYDHCPLIPFNPAAATGHTYWAIKEKCPSALELLEKTPTGKPKVNKEFVEEIADVLPEDLPIGRLAVVNKKLTMCLTFEKHLHLDGRLHPEFAHTRTLTGRLATSNPNCQNLPRPGADEDSKRFRRMFVARPGYVLMCADLDGIELRTLAYYLLVAEHDTGLADVFNSDNPDAHTRNAELWQVARNVAKTLIFLLIYGGQPALMVKRKLFATLAQAKAAFENVKQEQPSIDRLMQNVIKKAAKTGTIRTVGGRQLRYPDLASPNRQERKRAERQCFNALIQGSARDIMHRLAVESLGAVQAAGACFVNLVHDELLVEVPAAAAPALQEQLNSIWQKRPDLLPGVLVNGDWNIGNSWYEAK